MREAELTAQAFELLQRLSSTPRLRLIHPDEDVEVSLRTAIDAELDQLRRSGTDDEVDPMERVVRLADLQETYTALTEARLRRRIETHERVQDCIERMRLVASPAALLDRAAGLLCASGGFERVVLGKVTAGEWIVADAHFEGHDEWAKGLVRLGNEAPPVLTASLLETQMVRRRGPALVRDSQGNPHTYKPFVAYAESRCYVAAPVMPRGRVIGFIHADHQFSGRPVDATDCATLWALTLGFAHAYERAVLLERLRTQRDRISEMVTSTAALVTDLNDSEEDVDDESDLMRPDADRGFTRSRVTIALSTPDRPYSLTPREVEVLSLISTGATNVVIARELFIAEGTVKSHVKKILRKLGVSNRSQAVSIYLRTMAANNPTGGPASRPAP